MRTAETVAKFQAVKKFANKHGWTDCDPFEVVKVISPKCVEVRPMRADRDPTWEPEILPGGFAGHCVNQDSQRWIITSQPDAPTVRIRFSNSKKKRCGWYDAHGSRYSMADEPVCFYDYNF